MAFSLCITWAECNEGFDRVFTFNKIINLYYQRPSSEMCVQVDFGIIENDNDEKEIIVKLILLWTEDIVYFLWCCCMENCLMKNSFIYRYIAKVYSLRAHLNPLCMWFTCRSFIMPYNSSSYFIS